MTARPPSHTAAARIERHGGPDVLEYGQYPLAEPGPTDVVVEVHTAGVSGWDLKYRRGLPAALHLPGRAFFPLPQQLGREAAGTVIWIGDQVVGLAVGDHVVAVTHPENPHSAASARGLGNLSPGVAMPGHQALGAYARYLVRDQRMWLRLDPDVDLEQAALALWAYPTAHRVLHDRLRTDLGDVVVVLGSAGGMGMATIQLAKLMGARVVASTRTPTKAAALTDLGADQVLDLRDLDEAAAALRSFAGADGVDAVVDFAGNHDLLTAFLPTLRPGGSVCIAAGEQNPAPLPVRAADMVRLELNLLGVRGARLRDAQVVLELLTQGRIHTPVLSRIALSDVRQAHRALEEGLPQLGRVVLDPAG